MIDLRPATDRMTSLLALVSEDQFDLTTPCPDARVGDLVDHVGVLTKGFTAVARKDVDGTEAPVKPDAANLEAGWRDRITRNLATLADAWRDPAAWEGMTSAGGVALPGQVAGLVALDELVVHGWDIAVAIGQPYAPGSRTSRPRCRSSRHSMRRVTATCSARSSLFPTTRPRWIVCSDSLAATPTGGHRLAEKETTAEPHRKGSTRKLTRSRRSVESTRR